MMSIKCCCNLKTSLFVLFNAAAESENCSLSLKNLEKDFCSLTCKKTFVKHIENLPQHLSEKYIDYTDIAVRNRDLAVSPRAFLKLSLSR